MKTRVKILMAATLIALAVSVNGCASSGVSTGIYVGVTAPGPWCCYPYPYRGRPPYVYGRPYR